MKAKSSQGIVKIVLFSWEII